MEFEHPAYGELADAVVAIHTLAVTVENVEGEARIPLGEIRVAMRTLYEKTDSFTETDSAVIPDYVGITAWMHVWPYLRAEIQSLTTKVGFPPLLLPVLFAGQTADIPVTRLPNATDTAGVSAVLPPAKKKAASPKKPKPTAAKPKTRAPKKPRVPTRD